jgi:hypothetical protein
MAEPISDTHFFAKKFIRTHCPNLRIEDVDWAAASEPTDRYNCLGFAVGRRVWWEPPDPDDTDNFASADYWPDNVQRDKSIDAYIKAAETEGFTLCDNGNWEQGFEVIVLFYALTDKAFTHAARQKSPGIWESKIGALSDIEHTYDGLDNAKYGAGRVFMKRPRSRQDPSPSTPSILG